MATTEENMLLRHTLQQADASVLSLVSRVRAIAVLDLNYSRLLMATSFSQEAKSVTSMYVNDNLILN
jgi:hypothetical protein